MAKNVYNTYSTRTTPQSEPVPGYDMVKNKAGGYAFRADDWTRLRRFLVIGSDAGTYYTSPRKLTAENAEVVLRCIQEDGWRTVSQIVEVSERGLAPSNTPALFALALAISVGDEATRDTARNAVPLVCRIPTHLNNFIEFVQQFRGWGRLLRRTVADWYTSKDVDDLAYAMVKYRQRDGWTHADLIRLSHPKAKNDAQNLLFKWALGKEVIKESFIDDLGIVGQYIDLCNAKELQDVLRILRTSRLPWEAVPSDWLKRSEIWEVLIETMPPTALLRNLNRFASLGMTQSNMSDATKLIADRMTDVDMLRRSRLHPMKILTALRVYQNGQGLLGNMSWIPNQRVADSLDEAFYLSFGNVKPTGQKLLVAVDESGSMTKRVAGSIPMSCYEAGMAMALVMARTEPNVDLIGFDTSVHDMALSPKMRLTEAMMRGAHGGGTDCSLPFAYALGQSVTYDDVIIFSDNESWHGDVHLFQIANQYRTGRNSQTRLISMQAAANDTSLLNPYYSGDKVSSTSLDLEVVGLDAAAPELINAFISGEF